jgi:hypothetical protein
MANRIGSPPLEAFRAYEEAERQEARLTEQIRDAVERREMVARRRDAASEVIAEYLHSIEPGAAIVYGGRAYALSESEGLLVLDLYVVPTHGAAAAYAQGQAAYR